MRPCNRLRYDRRDLIARRSSMAAYASVTSQLEIEDAAWAQCPHRVLKALVAPAPAHGERRNIPAAGAVKFAIVLGLAALAVVAAAVAAVVVSLS